MKILKTISDSDSFRTLSQVRDNLINSTIPLSKILSITMLVPYWQAGFMGLQKLIEKDYQQEDEPYFLTPTTL